jgi:hypothetical protein
VENSYPKSKSIHLFLSGWTRKPAPRPRPVIAHGENFPILCSGRHRPLAPIPAPRRANDLRTGRPTPPHCPGLPFEACPLPPAFLAAPRTSDHCCAACHRDAGARRSPTSPCSARRCRRLGAALSSHHHIDPPLGVRPATAWPAHPRQLPLGQAACDKGKAPRALHADAGRCHARCSPCHRSIRVRLTALAARPRARPPAVALCRSHVSRPSKSRPFCPCAPL